MKKTTLSLILSALALCISLIALWRTLPAKSQQAAQPVEEQPAAADPALVGSWATNDAEMMIGDDGVVLIEYKAESIYDVVDESTGEKGTKTVSRLYVGHLDSRQLVMERSGICTMYDYLQNPDTEREWHQEYYVVPIEVPAKGTCRIDYRHIGAPFTFFRQ